MDSFGTRLTSEREERGLRIPEVAETLGVAPEILQALERDDYEALPAEPALMECFHAYAECLGVDAELMIADFVEEREKHRSRREHQVVAAPMEIEPPWPRQQRRRALIGLVVLTTIAIGGFAAWRTLTRDRRAPEPETDPPSAVAQTPPASSPAEVAGEPEPPSRPSPPPAATATATATATRLTVTDHGVGTAVENHLLVGRGDRFSPGTRVYFWTHVRGGAPGRRIDHVWLLDGVEVHRIPLRVAGPSWRTHSVKTLPAGGGNWAAEARDESGRVVARSEFVSR